MAGTANTSRFMIGAGTLMLGAQSALWDLQPTSHSVGLVKNVTLSTDPTFVDLTQGGKNTVVYSIMTTNPVKIAAEVYEFTAKNLMYGLSLDGTTTSAQTTSTVSRSTGIDGSPTPTTNVPVASATGFVAGDSIMVIPTGSDDQMIVRKVASTTTGPDVIVTTHAIGIDVASYTVQKVNLVPMGDISSNGTFLSAKIAGQLADGTPAVALFPKVKVTKGFTMAWNAEQFQNMPYEITIYDQLPTDTFYADFPTSKGGLYVQ